MSKFLGFVLAVVLGALGTAGACMAVYLFFVFMHYFVVRGKPRMSKMWLWPLTPFWTYTPWGYGCAIAWNISEIFSVAMPFGGHAFGIIVGCKKKIVDTGDALGKSSRRRKGDSDGCA